MASKRTSTQRAKADRQQRQRRGASQWAALIQQQHRSGLSVRVFCQQHDLSEPSFYAWRRRLGSTGTAMSESKFVRIDPTAATSSPTPMLELEFANGVKLRCDADRLEQVVRLLLESPGDTSC